MKQPTNLTVRVAFDGGVQMLFGNSYRTWDDQLDEYCGLTKQVPRGIVASPESWVGFGGLKWCHVDRFQEELDKEGKGRKLSDFLFAALPASCVKTYQQLRDKAVLRKARHAELEAVLA